MQTSDLDHPFRLYDSRTSLDQHTALFGAAQRTIPTSFQRGGWVNKVFAYGWTIHDKEEYVVLWDLRNTENPLQTIELPNYRGMLCIFYKGGRDLIVTGSRHIPFFTLWLCIFLGCTTCATTYGIKFTFGDSYLL